ncbi:hypothetical protein KP509_10G047200 [Ceratopteris richardii]|uniref:Secreted protein n=1 Tax=Ceratopteris richardii TaxID=49495 RepID=A0A8T2TYZ7_CERRI|nr:hypothetical protein KP509_10G047200 [Ceratopteris richardii]
MHAQISETFRIFILLFTFLIQSRKRCSFRIKEPKKAARMFVRSKSLSTATIFSPKCRPKKISMLL